MTGNAGPTWQKFPMQTLRQLFAAVEVNDVVDAHVALPEPIVLACPQDSIQRCYALCLQFWEDGVSRTELLGLVEKLLRNEGLNADERLRYKHMRARYKHLRFAQRLYGKKHQSVWFFDRTTIALGHLQDAFRSNQRSAILRYGLKLRLMLSKPAWAMLLHAMEQLRLDSEAGLIAYQRAEINDLKSLLALNDFSGDEFHDMRKIVSTQVSYYDTLRSLQPSEHALRMSRFLAAINGLMGARHDEMVAEALSGQRDYATRTPLNPETRTLLETLVARYPLSETAPSPRHGGLPTASRRPAP